jgi:YgiT-type zinc finger domain-containing protein
MPKRRWMKTVSRFFDLESAVLLVIERVPVITCTHCGESYLTAATLHELERIKRDRKELAAKRSVAVADFP